MREHENEEAPSRTKLKVPRDKLMVYGLTEAEIANITNECRIRKAMMTLRSRGAGVVECDVAQGNHYDRKDTVLTIAEQDHLWVC